ncbi:MAG: DUF892 family protein [Rhodospirillales bacterium]|nr:DUF892 family protein [Rhodospirillales bacterium]
MDKRETVVSWLRDAHAMEAAAVSNLERNIDRFKDYPTVQQKFREDLEQTRTHVRDLEQCLDQLGADRSALKDMAMKFTGVVQPYITAMSRDEALKHLLAANAYENFEVACYQSLLAAAEEAGVPQVKAVAERSLRQKKEMADWINQQVPVVTRDYLRRVQ